MADVQLEHGHVRIANRLAEALLYAEFSGVQFKILHALIRLTYGWRRKTVTLAHAELAAYIHVKVSGNFRAALNELIAEGVVVQAAKGGGGKVSTYTIEKDYVRWGKFSVSFERLERIYGERPDSDDDALVQGDVFRDQRPKESVASDRNSHKLPTETGISTAPKSLNDETCEDGKTVERQRKTEEPSSSPPVDDIARLLDGLPITARPAWEAEIKARRGGMHGPPVPVERIARAARQYVGDGHLARPTLRHFQGYLNKPERPPSARESPQASSRPAARANNSAAASPYAAALSGDDE